MRLLGEDGTGDALAFDEFGVATAGSQKAANPFGFTGYQRDDVSGLWFAQARYYVPQVGRFSAEDTHWNPGNMIYGDDSRNKILPDINAIRQSANLYSYIMNNPLRFFDPLGLECEKTGDFAATGTAVAGMGMLLTGLETIAVERFFREMDQLALNHSPISFWTPRNYLVQDTHYYFARQRLQTELNSQRFFHGIGTLVDFAVAAARIVVDRGSTPEVVVGILGPDPGFSDALSNQSRAVTQRLAMLDWYGENRQYQYLMMNGRSANEINRLIDARVAEISSNNEFSDFERSIILGMFAEVRALNENHAQSAINLRQQLGELR